MSGAVHTPVRRWSIKSALEQIAKCDFECEAGPITHNDAWLWLNAVAKEGPEYWPGQVVWYEVKAEAAGQTLAQWVGFTIVGCRMASGDDRTYWVYDLSRDPPGPYHYGTVHVVNARADSLRLENPKGGVK